MKPNKLMRKTYPAVGAALLTISAWISVPLPVPITMQSFTLFLLLSLFGGYAVLSLLLYLALGLLGVPVFAGFVGGIGVLLSPTGGFLVGFFPASLLFLLFYQRKYRILRFAGAVLSQLLLYLFGALFYAFVYGGGESLPAVLLATVLPYLIPDGIKLALAFLLAERMREHLRIT